MLKVLIPSRDMSLLDSCKESMESSEQGSSSSVITIDLRPFVYSSAINALAQRAGSSDILIMGDDTRVVSQRWLARCSELLADWPAGYGLINLCEIDIEGIQESRTTFAFVATLIPRKIWRQIGQMDESYTGYGWDDTDYCVRVLHAGLRIGITGTARIKHAGSGTYGKIPGIEAMTTHNRERFSEKWGVPVEQGFLPSLPHIERRGCACTNR